MATKINPDFYGAENTFVDIQSGDSKRSQYSLSALFTNNIYTGGQFDTTAAPWGCGKSSFASDYTFFAGKGQNWTVMDLYNAKKNTPMFMYWASSPPISGDVPRLTGDLWSVASYTRGLYKARMSPNTKYSNGSFRSTLSIDNNQSISIGSTDVPFYPITYLDYQKIRAVITDVWYKPEGATNNQKTTMTAIKNGTVSVDTIVAFKVLIYHKDSPSNAYPLYIGVGGAELDMPELYRKCYYGDDAEKWVRTWRYVQTFGYWELGSSSYGYQYTSTDSFNTTSWFNERNASDKVNRNSATSAWGHIMPDTQTFDDVTYTWHTGLYVVDTSDPQNLSNKIANGDLYASGTVGSYAYMTFDDYVGNKNIAAFNAILHEVAYIGLPFTYSTDYVGQPIGGNDIYLPIFDHMVTTGRFESGTRSLLLENATWGNVFGVDMPDYDPDYDPDAPPEPEEEDQGDLSNSYPNRYSNAGGLAQWVVSYDKVEDLAAFLNGSYLPSTADLDADFKGTNPQDYVVSVQKYPFTLPIQGTSVPTDIYIGKINSGIKGKKLYDDTFVHAVNAQSTFDFGAVAIPEYYGDFRDYQSKILLFMPFIGTDELDPKLYIGSTLSLIYKVDFNTGSVAAEIKRNGLTIETKTGNISITIPFMAANMGQYQNQLAQLSYAKDLTKIKGIGTALSAGFTMAAGAQATMSTGQPPLAAGSNLAQAGVQLAANATQLSQLDYQIEHTAPSVGTISTAAAANAFFLDDRARLIIIRPRTLAGFDSAAYAHTVGHACCIAGKLSDFSGYTIAAAAELSNIITKSAHYAATEQELELIKKALQAGVYL